jgi:hypothetical protein
MSSKNGRQCQNGQDGLQNLGIGGGCEPKKSLDKAANIGILRKIADDVRWHRSVWEIPVRHPIRQWHVTFLVEDGNVTISQFYASRSLGRLAAGRKFAPTIAVVAASAVMGLAAASKAATVTPIVQLNFTNPTVGAYGSDPSGTTLPNGTSAATYTEAGATYSGTNYAYTDTNGNGPTFANGAMSISSGANVTEQEAGLSVGAGSSSYALTNNYVYEAEVTSAGTQNSTTAGDIIQWETDNTGTATWIQLRLDNGKIAGYVSDDGNANNSLGVDSSTSLTIGVETHVALVYTYDNGFDNSTLSLYTIDDATGQGTQIGTETVGSLTLTSTDLPDQIGILNTAEDHQNSGTGNRAFNGSIDSVLVGKWTGTFNPNDASAGGDFQLASTPEPASLGLLAVGSILPLLRRRRAS